MNLRRSSIFLALQTLRLQQLHYSTSLLLLLSENSQARKPDVSKLLELQIHSVVSVVMSSAMSLIARWVHPLLGQTPQWVA